MNDFVSMYMDLKKKYENLKYKYKQQGLKNNELFHKNQELTSENIVLQGIVCEKLEITPSVLAANIKLLRKEKQVRATNIRINAIKELYKNGKQV
jgi:predicted nuclease with TOPRIM domain